MWNRCWRLAIGLQIWKDEHGQDLIEYALMASFVASSAGVLAPNVATAISTVFSRITSSIAVATQS